MKRKSNHRQEGSNSKFCLEDSKTGLSNVLFKNTENLKKKFYNNIETVNTKNNTPKWIDEDDEHVNMVTKTSTQTSAGILKSKYELLIGTPGWAKLNNVSKTSDSEDGDIMKTVGHLQKTSSVHLREGLLNIRKCPKINSETGNEGNIISCIEFHPKISAALVTGFSGVVSMMSIGGDKNDKLHSFKLKNWKSASAYFNNEGTLAYLSCNVRRTYCVYDLIKADVKLVNVSQIIKKVQVFNLSPNGKLLAISAGHEEVFIMCPTSTELLRTLKHNNDIQAVSFSENSEQLYCYCVQGEITVWDLTSYRPLKKFFDDGCVTASTICVSPCGKIMATGTGEGIVNVYDTTKLTTSQPKPIKTISNLKTRITNLRFNATSEILACASSHMPNALKLVHIPSYCTFSNFPQSISLNNVNVVSFSPHSGYMGVGNNRGSALLFRLKHYKNY